jgi:hypothetical protein
MMMMMMMMIIMMMMLNYCFITVSLQDMNLCAMVY